MTKRVAHGKSCVVDRSGIGIRRRRSSDSMSTRLRLRQMFEPRRDAPFPTWMIFPVIFAAAYASHFSLLPLPYYWDEAGYYIPAAWDFFRTGSLIPITTLSNAHPPLPSIYLALWWKLSGFSPEVTREAVLIVASLGLLAVWRLALRLTGSAMVAFWTVLLTGIYPIWFAQSTLAHADIFAAACTLWGLVYALPERDRKPWPATLWFMAAVLSKETAIAIPLTLAVLGVVEGLRSQGPERRRLWREAVWMAASLLPLCGWYCVALRKDRFCVRESRVSAIQRGNDDGAVADSRRVWPPDFAPDRAHESFCSVADDDGGNVAEATAGWCWA